MRVLVARCSIGYSGRLTTRLASGDRIVIFKDDGSVCVHGPKGFKPINYMSGPTVLEETAGLITIRRPATGETLMIEIEEVIADSTHALEDNASLEREGRELELHALLERSPDLIEEGLEVLEREHITDVGPVDFICKDTEGRIVLVEVKRVADRPGHDRRYALNCSKLRDIGWDRTTDFDTGLRLTVDWFRDNRPWWEAIKNGVAFADYSAKNYGTRS